MTARRRTVVLLTLGGTISCVPTARGLVPRLGPGDLVGVLPRRTAADVEGIALLRRTIVFPADWVTVARAVADRVGDTAGIVVTLGTDTLAYASSALTLMLRNVPVPVVLTGAMRPLAAPASDGRHNLEAAVAVARSGVPGVFVAFHGRVHAGHRVAKTRAAAADAFESINAEPLAAVARGRVEWRSRPPRPKGRFRVEDRCDPRVACLKLVPGTGPAAVRAVGRQRGLVVEGYGDGNVPAALVPALSRLARERVVVLASQCRYGAVHHRYEGGKALVQAGALSAGDRTTELAVVELMMALGRAQTPEHARRLFRRA